MSTPVPFSMFVIGMIVFILYITGYVYMIYKAHQQQKKEFDNDPELQAYYKSNKKKLNSPNPPLPANKSWPQGPASPGHLRCFCTILMFPYNECVT